MWGRDTGTVRVAKTTRLKQMLATPGLHFLMEAHNGLSAKIVEEAGFEGIWASGLALTAALGVRDNNEASWTQILEVVEFMADATRIPILLDGDTGYGNFNSARRLVTKLEQRGIAGVCIEDKLFPKTNSFLRGTAQPLADMHEHAGKIRAMKDAQSDPDFVVVARVEALIAGHGVSEAIKRAEAYRLAGADAILIHSSRREASEILAFKKEWGDRLPVVIVPTKYYTTPTDTFRDAGFRVAIWANHLMRAALKAMQQVAREIAEEQSLITVEPKVAPLDDVFRLQGDHELEQAEKLYLPKAPQSVRGVVLDGNATTLDGKPVAAHVMAALRTAGVRDLVAIDAPEAPEHLAGVTLVQGDGTGLNALRPHLEDRVVLASGGHLVTRGLIRDLMDVKADVVIAVDPAHEDTAANAAWVVCSHPASRAALLRAVSATAVAAEPSPGTPGGYWTGLLALSENGSRGLAGLMDELGPEALAELSPAGLLQRLIEAGADVRVLYARGGWIDAASLTD